MAPEPLKGSEYRDIPSLTSLPPQARLWWLQFGENQFPDGFGEMPDEVRDDPWLSGQQSVESSPGISDLEDSSSEQSIHVTQHAQAPWAHLQPGSLVAV